MIALDTKMSPIGSEAAVQVDARFGAIGRFKKSRKFEMGIKVKIGKKQTLMPPGEYLAQVTLVQEGFFAGKRKILEFHFEIQDGPHKGIALRGFVNSNYDSFSEHTKLRKWMSVITKDDVTVGEEIDLDLFYEKVLKVKVETKVSHKTKNEFSNVVDILGVAFDLS